MDLAVLVDSESGRFDELHNSSTATLRLSCRLQCFFLYVTEAIDTLSSQRALLSEF
jgi:hypothetical protein